MENKRGDEEAAMRNGGNQTVVARRRHESRDTESAMKIGAKKVTKTVTKKRRQRSIDAKMNMMKCIRRKETKIWPGSNCDEAMATSKGSQRNGNDEVETKKRW